MIVEIDDLKITVDYFNSNKLNFDDFFQVLLCINDFVEQGHTAPVVMEKVWKKLGKEKVKSKSTLSEIYYSFMKDYTEAMKHKKEKVIYEHLILYDKKIERELKDPVTKNPKYFNKLKIDRLMNCLETMKQKETLLGLHRRKTRIVLNNKLRFEKQKAAVQLTQIDTSLLSFEEKVELMNLLEKAKGDSLHIPDHFDYDKMNNVDDIAFEDVNKMPEIQSPVKDMKLTEQQQLPPAQVKTVEQIKGNLMDKFKQMAKKKFESRNNR